MRLFRRCPREGIKILHVDGLGGGGGHTNGDMGAGLADSVVNNAVRSARRHRWWIMSTYCILDSTIPLVSLRCHRAAEARHRRRSHFLALGIHVRNAAGSRT